MLNNFYKKFLLFFILALCFFQVHASHIVGGEMTYTCLGNNRYEIVFTLFRDCENGNPGAYFDDPAYIGVFDGFGNYLQTEQFFFSGDDTLDLQLANPCYVVPPNVCIHTTTYRKILVLPYRVGGYHLAYQRCCRNNIIVNIVSPDLTGATYDVVISDQALLNCNNSATFREWPPFYICLGSPINYDNSAIDVDGDSLVYELCNPYVGANTGDPAPFTPSPPPYQSVNWQFPYSLNNMLGGSSPLTINPTTGLLTGIPPNLGTFVVGLCVKEYRNGVLIGITKRDFQYTVGICNKENEALFAPNIQACNTSFVVPFVNQSNTTSNSYQWNFGDNSSITTVFNPVHTFPDTGTYFVQLIAASGEPCADTITLPINVEIDGADVLVNDVTGCLGDTVMLVALNPLSSYNDLVSFNWTPAGDILSGQGTDTVYVVASNFININLNVSNENGCTDNDQALVLLELVEANFDTLDLDCNTTLSLTFPNTSSAVNNAFFWDFGGTGTSTDLYPTHTFPDTGSYNIQLIAGVGALCQDTLYREIYIPLDGASVLWAGPQEACYGDTVVMTATNQLEDYNSIINFTWSPNDLILSGQGTDSVAVLADSSVILSLYVLNDNGCEDTIFTPLDVIRINALFDSLNLVCNTTLTHTFNNTSINSNTDFLWVFDGTGGSNQINPTHTFPDTGLYAITLIAGYNSLCPDTFQLDFDLNLDGALITASDSQLVCRGDTLALYAYNQLSDYNEILYYDWSPGQNIIIGQGTDTVDVLATADLDFIVTGTNDFGCSDTAIAHVNVTDLTPPLAIVAIPDSIFLGQTSQLYATNFQNYIYEWVPDSTLSALDIYNPLATPRDDHTYYLYVTNDYCTAFDSVTVFIKDPICGNPVVFIPNAFSPDGDGFNDQLFVNGNNINELNLMVFNRWGQKVFETNDQSIGWDGSFNGQVLAPDVYGYYLRCLCDDGGVLILKGNITLLR